MKLIEEVDPIRITFGHGARIFDITIGRVALGQNGTIYWDAIAVEWLHDETGTQTGVRRHVQLENVLFNSRHEAVTAVLSELDRLVLGEERAPYACTH